MTCLLALAACDDDDDAYQPDQPRDAGADAARGDAALGGSIDAGSSIDASIDAARDADVPD